jgi:hypothetical protein
VTLSYTECSAEMQVNLYQNIGHYISKIPNLHKKNTYQQKPRLQITDTHRGKFCSLSSFEQMMGKEVKCDLVKTKTFVTLKMTDSV